jgi:hypothetical protein
VSREKFTRHSTLVLPASTRNQKLETRNLLTILLPPSANATEATAAEPPGATCPGAKSISPAAASPAKAALRTAKPAGLILAEAVESVLALSARLLFFIGPRSIAPPRSANCRCCAAAAKCY